jgi:hypothetical protein
MAGWIRTVAALANCGGSIDLELRHMPRTGLAYEKPSRVSQGLVVGFSIAVVVMTGWLVTMIMSSHDANTMAADPADIPPVSTPPQVLAAAPEPIRLSPATRSTARSTSALAEPTPWPYTPYSAAPAAPPAAALPLASPAPQVAAPAPTYSTSSLPAAVPDANESDLRTYEPPPRIEAAVEAPEAVSEVIPLPPPKPRRVASIIPVPRPRPHLDGDDAPPQERSLFDQLFNPQR